MKSRDVAELYAQLPIGAIVEIVNDRLPNVPKAPAGTTFALQSVKPEPKPEPEKVADVPEAPVEKAVEKPAPKSVEKPAPKPAKNAKTVKKSLQEQPHFGSGA